jgi:Zn-dependent protease
MNPTIVIGRIAGVRIGFNWSWLIVFVLIAWSLAANVFPSQNPGHSDGTYAAMAIVAAVLFFGSLLLHELGHAIQARREGMVVEDITLWLFGGVARFRGDLPSAGAEFRIAIAGPVVSLVIGCSFVALAATTQLGSAIDGVAAWLGFINLILLAFNMLPALPLDGGRVLRSALWGARHDFNRATTLAVEISRGFAFLLIFGGVALAFAGDAIGGIWLAFIGWFLLAAAASEGRYLLVRDALAGLRVRDVMEPHPVTAHPGQTLATFMDEVARSARFTAYPVTTDGQVVGLLPFNRVLGTPWREWEERRVDETMLRRDEVPVFGPGDPATEALQALAAAPLQRGLVLSDGALVGLLSISDFARLLAAAERPLIARA